MTDTEIKRRKAICEVAGVKEIGDVSDGFHTFKGLYYQRMMLFATIVKQNKDKSWKSLRHEDGELCFGGGWFVVGIDTPEGSYTYHYEDNFYSLFDCIELERGKHWDGHTEKDVARLLTLENQDSDCISRKEAVHALRQAMYDYEDKTEAQFIDSKELDVGDWFEHRIFVQNMNDIDVQTINNLPSVTPKPKEGLWIPVNEKLPKAEYGESDSVLVCFENETQDVLYFDGSNWCYPTGETYISVNHKNDWHNKVIAWMPLPQPYNAESEEENNE